MKADLQGRCYRDFLGRVLYVSPSLTNGTTRRVKSKWLPLRETREEAQGDLDRYAEGRGLSEVQND